MSERKSPGQLQAEGMLQRSNTMGIATFDQLRTGINGPSPEAICNYHAQEIGYCRCSVCEGVRQKHAITNMARQIESLVTDKDELTRLRAVEAAARAALTEYDKDAENLDAVASKMEALRAELEGK